MDRELSSQDTLFDQTLERALTPPERVQALSAELSFERLNARLEEKGRTASKPFGAGRTVRTPAWRRIAPGLVAATLLVVGWNVLRTDRIPGSPSATPPAFQSQYTTAPGEQATMTLRDGTQVMLNVGSRIHLDDGFGVTHRTLELHGEARFTVTPDARKPFTVRANGTVVRDLATVFTVRAYQDAPHTRVAVREGKVSVQSPAVTASSAVPVDAGHMAVVQANGIPVVQAMTADDDAFAWTAGQLVLRQTPLAQALSELSRWYGLEFRVSDTTLLEHVISSRFSTTLTPAKLQDVADVIGARVEQRGPVVTFSRK